jgi:hypothetical protein
MRIKKRCAIPPTPDEVIGQFGQVRLIRKWGEIHDLAGGNQWERWMARLWCAAHAPFLAFVETVGDEIALGT